MWSERKIPILLVCEEAHRYIPADTTLGFNSTRRAISRIAKEGRKYGVSLAIISQRPSELEPSTLSQCSTIFSMRLSNEVDQNFVKAAVPDGAAELLSFLPSLGTAETMVFGESVNLPMRVVLNTLAARGAKTRSVSSASAAREHMQRALEQTARPSQAAGASPHYAVPRAPNPNNPTRSPIDHAAIRAAAQRIELTKTQSLSDVKNMLNTAFNRGN